jgi:Gdp/GTP exchange factor required for growth at low temperatures
VQWVLTSIIKQSTTEAKSLLLGKFIQIAKHCLTLRNYSGYMQIFTALEDPTLRSSPGIWESLPRKYVPVLLELRKFTGTSTFGSYEKIKTEMYTCKSACVPFIRK